MNESAPSNADWLQPALEQQGIRRLLETLRERWMVVALVVVLVTGMAIAYAITADAVYEAEVDMLIAPVPADDETLASLGLITESNDPTLDVQTAARLLTTPEVATVAQQELGSQGSAAALLDNVRAEPLGQSNIVAVIARGPSPDAAQTLAETFAASAVEHRDTELEMRIDAILPRLLDQLGELPPGELAAQSLADSVTQLELLRATGDPTITLESVREAPEAPVSPKRALAIAVGGIGGLVLGILAALALQALDPRLRREEQLRSLFRLPVIGRIPKERSASGPLAWRMLSPAGAEGYRTMRMTLTAPQARGVRPRSILITGSSPSEGKTTTAINLATSLASGGNRTILIEGDLRRPAIAQTLQVSAERGVVATLLNQASLEDALVSAPSYPGLSVLLAETSGEWASEVFSLPTAGDLVAQAEKLADYVIVDSPPLTEIIDALPLARQVDEVLLVARLGKSRLRRIRELGELLAANGIKPAGFAVLGAPQTSEGGYYYQRDPRTGQVRPRRPLMRQAGAGQSSQTVL